jgi:hypothetical protein
MDEEWKDITGYEGLYQISNRGKVKSFHRSVNGSIIKNHVDSGGYLFIQLKCKNKLTKHFSIHRLVALHFIENLNNKPQVNHKDGNKTNNHVDNLEWVTSKENIQHSIQTGLTDISRKSVKETCSKPILQYSKDNIFIKEYVSIIEAATENNLSIANISRCCNNKYGYKTCGGFIWKFKI